MYYKAKTKALSNGAPRAHLAAVLKRGDSILRISTNQQKTHPMSLHTKPTGDVCCSLHAEQAACRFAKPGDTLYVMRFKKDGTLAIAKPCTMCEKTIRQIGLSKVYYTDRQGNWNRLKLR